MNRDDHNSKFLPVTRLFPNLVTLLGMCAGLTAIRFTFVAKWELAVIFIVIAAIVDGMDGRIARLLNSTSGFGAQLDSFADFVNFGVAPGILIYFWVLKDVKVIGWMLVMVYVICMAIRLARFNVALYDEDNKPEWRHFFFVGVPAPLGALLAVMPIVIMLHYEQDVPAVIAIALQKTGIAIYFAVVAFLLVSNVPTFSAKYFYIPKNLSYLFILLFAILIILFITKPWITLPVVGLIYMLSIPVSISVYLYMTYKK